MGHFDRSAVTTLFLISYRDLVISLLSQVVIATSPLVPAACLSEPNAFLVDAS